MDINNTSDDILKFALDNGRVFTTHGDKEKLAFVGRERAVHQAMLTMCGATPPLFKQLGGNFIYDLTGDGESFANEGGYAGQRQREQEKRIAEADDRQLARLVSESTMEVNKSIVEINKSIDKHICSKDKRFRHYT